MTQDERVNAGPQGPQVSVVMAQHLCYEGMHAKSLQSCPTLRAPWTIPCQAPLSMGFSKQEYWSELPFPSPRDLPDIGIEPRSPALLADSLLTELRGKPQTSLKQKVDDIDS